MSFPIKAFASGVRLNSGTLYRRNWIHQHFDFNKKWLIRLLRHCGFQSTAGEIRGDSVPASVTDRYHFRWWGWPDDMEEFGEILQANGLNHFEFTFTANEMNDMKVQVRLSKEAEFVRVTLHQYDIPVTEKGKCYFHLGCTKGWTFYLSNLKSILEGGLDLRNKDENVKRVINS